MPISNLDKLHYSFCSDLGYKVVADGEWPTKLDFSLFKVKQKVDEGFSGIDVFNDEKLFIPGFYEVKKVGQDFWDTLTEKEYQTFIAPTDYNADGKLFYEFQTKLLVSIPNEIFQHKHLPTHSTFQFYFLNNSLFTANLPYLDIGDFENNGSQQIRVHWAIKANPAGTYVVFRSGHIFFKWKIEVRQGIVNMSLVKVMIDGVSQTIKGATQAAASFFGIDTSGADKAKEEMASNLVGKDRGGSFMERERSQRIQEQQTARMFQSALSHAGDNPIEPSIFYANTVKFPYNLFDFWLRTEQKAFICRFYYSNNLLNNLKHNNNENPITYPLNITFEKLGYILRPGYFQGKLTLDYDPDGRMAECFARGVTFYEDKKEHFINPDLGVKEAVNRVQYSSFCHGQNYTAQAITDGDEPWTNEINRTKGSNYHQRAHFFITFEDGSKDHWLVLFPQSFQDSDLHEGHTHGGFDLKFNKPVKEFIDVYTCIGCGAASTQGYGVNTPGFLDLHRDYDGGNDSLDRIHKGLPYNPWFDKLTSARLEGSYWKTADNDRCLGSSGDVWEFTGQYIRGKDNKPFNEAYGFIPTGGTIRWTTKGGTSRIEWQKIPGHDDFDQLDWSPPAGSGGETEIPLSDPEINVPEPGEGDIVPDNDFPEVDPFDLGGGEPEILPIEPDIPPDIDVPDDEPGPDIDIPDIEPPEIDPPEIDPNEPDPGQDPDPNDIDPGDVDPGGDDEDGD
ncbi:hypothetical protein [endosymbiont GvMRE of Glomus versiforme]|uniref:hypothetical protein n=1 Tax=endosymbiont GvMRE of Glomus versiforme TaxID=2039283 RepID=UPI000EED57C3|nr:hypothetical protein [endosymbiont GvMRE of Glomus versiforme]RHZ36445.1 hypothetical protein GvMRE_Ic1g236 [endosymbiont GvMRE of Glomus versiforme]